MISLGKWLVALLPKLTRHILISLGFGFLTFAGLEEAYQQIFQLVPSYFNGIPQDMLMLMNIAGFGEGVNIILSGISARVSYYILAKTQRAIFTRGGPPGPTTI